MCLLLWLRQRWIFWSHIRDQSPVSTTLFYRNWLSNNIWWGTKEHTNMTLCLPLVLSLYMIDSWKATQVMRIKKPSSKHILRHWRRTQSNTGLSAESSVFFMISFFNIIWKYCDPFGLLLKLKQIMTEFLVIYELYELCFTTERIYMEQIKAKRRVSYFRVSVNPLETGGVC